MFQAKDMLIRLYALLRLILTEPRRIATPTWPEKVHDAGLSATLRLIQSKPVWLWVYLFYCAITAVFSAGSLRLKLHLGSIRPAASSHPMAFSLPTALLNRGTLCHE